MFFLEEISTVGIFLDKKKWCGWFYSILSNTGNYYHLICNFFNDFSITSFSFILGLSPSSTIRVCMITILQITPKKVLQTIVEFGNFSSLAISVAFQRGGGGIIARLYVGTLPLFCVIPHGV